MSREGVSIAARDRARRLQAALGEGATVLLGCTLVVLQEPARRAVVEAPRLARAANDAVAAVDRPVVAAAAERAR
jgi:hypothetical protein